PSPAAVWMFASPGYSPSGRLKAWYASLSWGSEHGTVGTELTSSPAEASLRQSPTLIVNTSVSVPSRVWVWLPRLFRRLQPASAMPAAPAISSAAAVRTVLPVVVVIGASSPLCDALETGAE